MKTNDIIQRLKENHLEVMQLVKDLQLLDAANIVKDMLDLSGIPEYKEKIRQDEQTFDYVLRYMQENLPDPNRGVILSEIADRLLTYSDLAVRATFSKDSDEYYYSVMRLAEYRNEKLGETLERYGECISELNLALAVGEDNMDLHKQKESLSEQMFNSIFTSLGDEQSIRNLGQFLTSGYAEEEIISIAVSALTLALLKYYETAKIEVLLDIIEKEICDSVSAKALIGIMLSLSFYPERININRKITSRLKLWQDSPNLNIRLKQAIQYFVGCRDTEMIASKINNEVLPELMKIKPEIMARLKEMTGSTLDAETLEELKNNPDWEEMIENSGISEKLQELNEMQNEGADIMMVTFSRLKQFPFFNSALNWFIPFDSCHSALSVPEELQSLLAIISGSGNTICDSDMYSLALAASSMPESQRKLLFAQLQMQREQLNEAVKSEIKPKATENFNNELQKAIRDLYRFFKLFRKKEGLRDPFSDVLPFYDFPVVSTLLNENDFIEVMAEFYFKRGYYSDSLKLFKMMERSETEDAVMLEKIGFCEQSLGNFEKAFEAYEKSSLISKPGPWLLKKLAFLSKSLGKKDLAISYYRLLLIDDPENQNLLLNLGHLLVDQKQYGEALQHYYHANYLWPENTNIMRAIAWVELIIGNFEKSKDLYLKIISKDPSGNDYLNAGHAYFLLNNMKEAMNLYRLASENSTSDFKNSYKEDMEQLKSLGLDTEVMLLMLQSVMK